MKQKTTDDKLIYQRRKVGASLSKSQEFPRNPRCHIRYYYHSFDRKHFLRAWVSWFDFNHKWMKKSEKFFEFYFFLISFVISICHQNVKMCLQSTFWISLTDTLNRMQECCTVLCIYSFHLCFFLYFHFLSG